MTQQQLMEHVQIINICRNLARYNSLSHEGQFMLRRLEMEERDLPLFYTAAQIDLLELVS